MSRSAPKIEIEIPLPPPETSPNARSHWRAKAEAIRIYRDHAAGQAIINMRLLGEPDWLPLKQARIRITYFHKTVRFRDPDNILASLKPAIDGLQDAGLLADDRDVVYPPVLRKHDPQNPRVKFTITPAKRIY